MNSARVFTIEPQGNPQTKASRLVTDYFRCPNDLVNLTISSVELPETGYFRFGANSICYGKCSSGTTSPQVTETLHDALPHVVSSGSSVELPFDPVQVIDNLRHERYVSSLHPEKTPDKSKSFTRKLYYLVRPMMTVALRKHLQRLYLRNWKRIPFPHWPVDTTVEEIQEQLLILVMKNRNISAIPFIWFWPKGAPSCTSVTHDVEAPAGLEFCDELMKLDDSYGIKSAFQMVPEERYELTLEHCATIRARGFEVNLHDLNHDGNLIGDYDEFLRRAKEINVYAKKFGTRGFRAGVLYRNLDWYGMLDFEYDMSVPNVAHLDPQHGGCCTVFPFFNGTMIELPVTMSQDYTLFNILNDYSIELWKEQIASVRKKNGLMQMIVHPDYVMDRKAQKVYGQLLGYLADMRDRGDTWIALPGDVADWWRLRSQMKLVKKGNSWQIEGQGCEDARIAYARLVDGKIQYELEMNQ